MPTLRDGYFNIEFIELKKSRYASKYIIITGLSQEDILGSKISKDDDPYAAYEVEYSVTRYTLSVVS